MSDSTFQTLIQNIETQGRAAYEQSLRLQGAREAVAMLEQMGYTLIPPPQEEASEAPKEEETP